MRYFLIILMNIYFVMCVVVATVYETCPEDYPGSNVNDLMTGIFLCDDDGLCPLIMENDHLFLVSNIGYLPVYGRNYSYRSEDTYIEVSIKPSNPVKRIIFSGVSVCAP